VIFIERQKDYIFFVATYTGCPKMSEYLNISENISFTESVSNKCCRI